MDPYWSAVGGHLATYSDVCESRDAATANYVHSTVGNLTEKNRILFDFHGVRIAAPRTDNQ